MSVSSNMAKYEVCFFRVLIFLLYLWTAWVARSAPQSSKTTWAVCCSPGNALEGGLGSCSELKIQIRLVLYYSPLNPALLGEMALVRGGNCVLCLIDLEFLRALFCSQCLNSWVLQAAEVKTWTMPGFMGFLFTLPSKMNSQCLHFLFLFLLTFFGCSFTDISLSFPHIPMLPFETDCEKETQGLIMWNLTHLDSFGGWSPFP